MLKLAKKKFHKVAPMETLEKIAETYRLPVRELIKANGLKREVQAGEILLLPERKGDLYTAQAGDNKELLCGSKEKYEEKNGKILYPGLKVWL